MFQHTFTYLLFTNFADERTHAFHFGDGGKKYKAVFLNKIPHKGKKQTNHLRPQYCCKP